MPTFADGDFWQDVGPYILPTLTSAGAGIYVLMDWWNKRRDSAHRQRRDDDQWVLDKSKDIIVRLDAHNQELLKDAGECQKREARLQRIVVYLYGMLDNYGNVMRTAGMPTEAMVPLAELLDDPAAVEFRSRTTQQGAASLHEEAKQALESLGPKP